MTRCSQRSPAAGACGRTASRPSCCASSRRARRARGTRTCRWALRRRRARGVRLAPQRALPCARGSPPWRPSHTRLQQVLPQYVPSALDTFAESEGGAAPVEYPPAIARLEAHPALMAAKWSEAAARAPEAVGRADLAAFRWAHACVMSRTFGNAAPGGGVGVRMLVPLVDVSRPGGGCRAGGRPPRRCAGTPTVPRACTRPSVPSQTYACAWRSPLPFPLLATDAQPCGRPHGGPPVGRGLCNRQRQVRRARRGGFLPCQDPHAACCVQSQARCEPPCKPPSDLPPLSLPSPTAGGTCCRRPTPPTRAASGRWPYPRSGPSRRASRCCCLTLRAPTTSSCCTTCARCGGGV